MSGIIKARVVAEFEVPGTGREQVDREIANALWEQMQRAIARGDYNEATRLMHRMDTAAGAVTYDARSDQRTPGKESA